MTRATIKPVPDQAGHAPSPIPAFQIADMFSATDAQLGTYLEKGGEADRQEAIQQALRDAHALVDVLSTIDDDSTDIRDGTTPGSIGRLAWIAQARIELVMALQDHAPMEGSDNE